MGVKRNNFVLGVEPMSDNPFSREQFHRDLLDLIEKLERNDNDLRKVNPGILSEYDDLEREYLGSLGKLREYAKKVGGANPNARMGIRAGIPV